MALVRCALLLISTVCVLCQRPGFAGRRPIGYPELYDLTTTAPDPLGNRFGESTGTTERLPLEANGDRDLVTRLSKLPVDKQPFWFINWKALETQRKSPQTYPLRPNPFVESGNNVNQNIPANSNSNSNAFSNPNLNTNPNSNSNSNSKVDSFSNQNVQPQFLNDATTFNQFSNNGGDLQNRFNSYPNSNSNTPQVQTIYYKPEQYTFLPSVAQGQASYLNNGLPNQYLQNQNNQPVANSQNSNNFNPSPTVSQGIIQNRFSDVHTSSNKPFISALPPDQFKVLKVESVSSLTTPEGKVTLTNPNQEFSVPQINAGNSGPTPQGGIKKDPSNFEIENSKVVYYSSDPQNPNGAVPVPTIGVNTPLAISSNNAGPPRNITSGLQVLNSKITHKDIDVPNGQNPDAKIKTQNTNFNTMTSTDEHTVTTDPKTNITRHMHKWGYQNQYNYTYDYQYHVPYTYTIQPTKLT